MGECVKGITLDEAIENARKVANSGHQPLMSFETMNSIVKDNYREENEQLAQWLEELKEYKELEEKLSVMFGGDCKFSDVVESLEKQITEPGKDHPVNARILTYEDAEKWNEYLELEEQGRLVKLPCKVGDTLWWVSDEDEDGNDRLCVRKCEESISLVGIDRDGDIVVLVGDPVNNTIDKLDSRWACLTKEEAEAKLKEMEKSTE